MSLKIFVSQDMYRRIIRESLTLFAVVQNSGVTLQIEIKI
jgi:hypothetical protein